MDAHVCTDACRAAPRDGVAPCPPECPGHALHPGYCPHHPRGEAGGLCWQGWPDFAEAHPRGSPEWLARCTPQERFALDFDLALAAAAKRSAALLLEALRPELERWLAAELPAALDALRVQRRRP